MKAWKVYYLGWFYHAEGHIVNDFCGMVLKEKNGSSKVSTPAA
jgi:hypothetical protein